MTVLSSSSFVPAGKEEIASVSKKRKKLVIVQQHNQIFNKIEQKAFSLLYTFIVYFR
jgi:hypothetical protein